MIYFIGDTHFRHKNIIQYANRPYTSVESMGEDLIRRWNSVVSHCDTVYHLGDIAFGEDKELYCQQLNDSVLNGKKIYIKGNHDHKWKKLIDLGLDLHQAPLWLHSQKLVLSHKPMDDSEIPDGYVNVHAHIHDHKLNKMYDPRKHFCVSVEKIGYTPISLTRLNRYLGR